MKHAIILGITIMSYLFCACSLHAAGILIPQQGIGTKYDAPDPYRCGSTSEPTAGQISPGLAASYVQCALEGESNTLLTLLDHVEVQVAPGIPWSSLSLVERPQDANPNGKRYAIRGSYDEYSCDRVFRSGALRNVGKNCGLRHVPDGTGKCYRTTFGDWKCTMFGDVGSDPLIPNQPPPKR